MRVRNKDSYYQRYAMKTWFDFDQDIIDCDWPVAWPSDIMCACWWWTLLTHALKWLFIYMIHQNILWNRQCNLMHVGLTSILYMYGLSSH